MFGYVVLLFSVLLCCEGHDIPDFNFTLSSKHNQTGHWYADVQFGHEEGETWDLNVHHTTINRNGTKILLIKSKIMVPLIEQSENKTHSVNYTALTSVGYQLFPGLGYYKLHAFNRTWHDALEVCRQEGAHLLIINSKHEENAITSLIEKAGLHKPWYWIGVHDQYNEGHYITIFNTTLESTGYVNWFNTQPYGGDEVNCLWFVYYTKEEYGLNDADCDDSDYFICELEL